MYSVIVVVLIVFFTEETIYDHTVRPIPGPTTTGLRYRIETLIGVTGSKYHISCINVTNAVFLGSLPPVGYSFSQFAIMEMNVRF